MLLYSPSNIEVLLHCHYSPEIHPRHDAPAVMDGINMLLENELITYSPSTKGAFVTTEKGKFHVNALCNLPFPVSNWVTPDHAGEN